MTIQKCFKITIHWLLMTAFLGLLLRLFFVSPVPFLNFKYLLHSHSHIAILGWLFLAAYLFIVKNYIHEDQQAKFLKLFMYFQIAIAGMFITFLIQGYGAFSIFFSTVHIILSYVFVFMILKDKINIQRTFSFTFIKISFFLLLLSTAGPWFLSYLAANDLVSSSLYSNTIYFYLHFQYNGWLSFAVLGLFFRYFEMNNVNFEIGVARAFRNLMFIACFPSYFLSVLWIKPAGIFYVIGFAGALIQIIALGYLIKIILKLQFIRRHETGSLNNTILVIALASFIIKIFLQLLSSFPLFAELAYQYRNFVIGYLHLVLIGFLSLFFIFLLNAGSVIVVNSKRVKAGYSVFIAGFVLSESLIFIQPVFAMAGIIIPFFDVILFVISLMLLAGITMIAVKPGVRKVNAVISAEGFNPSG